MRSVRRAKVDGSEGIEDTGGWWDRPRAQRAVSFCRHVFLQRRRRSGGCRVGRPQRGRHAAAGARTRRSRVAAAAAAVAAAAARCTCEASVESAVGVEPNRCRHAPGASCRGRTTSSACTTARRWACACPPIHPNDRIAALAALPNALSPSPVPPPADSSAYFAPGRRGCPPSSLLPPSPAVAPCLCVRWGGM